MTEFNIVTNFEGATLVEAKPITGRTHQIRVHALDAGHPLLGDDKYGDPDLNRVFRARGLHRLFLHAVSLEFTLPESQQTLKVEAPLSDDLQTVINELGAAG